MGNITHSKVSGIPDGDDESLVRPSDWNAEHEVSAPTEGHDVATKEYVDGEVEVLDYGLSFRGVVTTYTNTTHFRVSSLADMGAGFFKPVAGAPYEIYVVQADGAIPEGQQTPVVSYSSTNGIFEHTAFSGGNLAVGDIVLIVHPLIASLGTKATAAATGAVTTTDYLMAYLKQLVTELQVADALIDAIKAKTDNMPTDPADQSLLMAAIAVVDGVVDDIKAVTAIIPDAGALTTLLANVVTIMNKTNNLPSDPADQSLIEAETGAIQTVVNAIKAKTDNLPSDPADQSELDAALSVIWTAVQAIQAKTGNLPSDPADQSLIEAETGYIRSVVDAILGSGWTTSDWKGNFNWDTASYTTVEQDISALFSTNLALDVRRKYSVKLDLTNVEADGSFTELYLAVKEKIDGTNYRAIDRKTVTKANIAATAEPGIPIDIPATSENIQITMQMETALAGDATIYYAVVKEHLE